MHTYLEAQYFAYLLSVSFSPPGIHLESHGLHFKFLLSGVGGTIFQDFFLHNVTYSMIQIIKAQLEKKKKSFSGLCY